jgi:hypothetical protein
MKKRKPNQGVIVFNFGKGRTTIKKHLHKKKFSGLTKFYSFSLERSICSLGINIQQTFKCRSKFLHPKKIYIGIETRI